jgi:hypothetical protein
MNGSSVKVAAGSKGAGARFDGLREDMYIVGYTVGLILSSMSAAVLIFENVPFALAS